MSATLRGTNGARRILVIANETASSPEAIDALVRRARGSDAEVLVIAPALNTRLHHWMSDEDGAHHAAGERLADCLATLNLAGVDAQGWVGDADPIMAVADAIPFFAPDEVVILTHPPQRSHWLARDVVRRTRSAFGLPVMHLVMHGAEAPVERAAVAA